MASSKDYLQFILDQLSNLSEISYRYMMGEYILYFHGKIVGGIYDNRLLLKPTKKAENLIENPEVQIPYPGAKPMLFVDNVDNSEYLENLVIATYEELYGY